MPLADIHSTQIHYWRVKINSDEVVINSCLSLCEVVNLHLNESKVSGNLKTTIQNIICRVKEVKEEVQQEIPALSNSI